VRFVNTRYLFRGQPQDLLDSAESTLGWLRSQADLAESPLTEADLGRAQLRSLRGLRDTLAELFRSTDWPLPAAQLAILNAMSRQSPSWVELDPDGQRTIRHRGSALAAVRSMIAADGIELLSRQADLVRQCSAPSCVVYFVADRPRRQWCCAACGNRARVARHYQRQQASAH